MLCESNGLWAAVAVWGNGSLLVHTTRSPRRTARSEAHGFDRHVQFLREVGGRFVYATVIGNHLLREVFDFGRGRPRLGEFAGIDVTSIPHVPAECARATGSWNCADVSHRP
jgi:hypothetical protein